MLEVHTFDESIHQYIYRFHVQSVLHFAVDSQSPNTQIIVRHLLNNGADPMTRNRHDDTVLHYAVKNSEDPQIFAELLEHIRSSRDPAAFGSAISATNDDGLGLIHLIVKSGKIAHMEILLSAIDRTTGGGNAKSPLSERNVSVQELQQHIESFRGQTAGTGTIAVRPMKCALLNQPEKCTGRTALLRAIVQRDSEVMVLLLLAHNADPRITDFGGLDCLQACAHDDQKASIDLSMYVQLSSNLLQSLTDSRVRPVRCVVKSNGIQQQQTTGAPPTLRISCVDQAILMEHTQKPKRPYKRRTTNNANRAPTDAAIDESRRRKL